MIGLRESDTPTVLGVPFGLFVISKPLSMTNHKAGNSGRLLLQPSLHRCTGSLRNVLVASDMARPILTGMKTSYLRATQSENNSCDKQLKQTRNARNTHPRQSKLLKPSLVLSVCLRRCAKRYTKNGVYRRAGQWPKGSCMSSTI